ncbi:haloacid dehalogenase type II [Acinetobacter baumannii]|jgi:2-haloacid dehalogenase|uniref:Haloacid dehalogenase type II n=2 Tax=Acinetobacter TaxID=469 RepID=A0AAW8Z1Q3_9GAMM|nr:MULTISPECIES: haloacid dehalogenase type II [Acinetobacter]MCK7609864.1 haloacid dehalogenase type II [Acinetobacter portensis]MCK7640639.1 haloacid dehalogenase type II [Acinetobacter portensis]MDV4314488.1 haloacid dehalogenase type II [Acinetobacter indicus]UPO24820.1 haloacid dehalogenase type II [Acinetobacter portensis]
MKNFIFKLVACLNIFLVTIGQVSAKTQDHIMEHTTTPRVIFFDVNETLLDLEPLKKSVSNVLNNNSDLMKLWFTTMLQYSLVETSTKQYHDFGQVGLASLVMVANNQGITLSEEKARQALIPILHLPAHQDVRSGLKLLKQKGYKIYALTNSSKSSVEKQLTNANIIDLFDGYLSAGELESYKPNLKVYQWAAQKVQTPIENSMLVAAHGWDITGAQNANMKTAFISRKGQSLYPLAQKPNYIFANIVDLANALPSIKH